MRKESAKRRSDDLRPEYDLKALSAEEVAGYVAHRLMIAGYLGPPLIDRAAISALHKASRGIPRLVNILAHKSLLLVYGEGGYSVQRRHVREAVADTPAAAPPQAWWRSAVRGLSLIRGAA